MLMVGSMLNMRSDQSLIAGMAADFSHHIVIALAWASAVGSGVVALVAAPRRAALQQHPEPRRRAGRLRHRPLSSGSGLLAVLIFGITLANVPRTPHMTRQGARMLAFHAELSFLVRSFFFVMLGIVAEFISRNYIIPILGILAALVLARFLAVQGSRWAVRDVTRKDTELLFWMLPRGLVTAVLALEIVTSRRGVCLPAGHGVHRRPGDEPVHRLGIGEGRTRAAAVPDKPVS